MEIDREALKAEIKEKLKELKPLLSKPPDIENFLRNYKQKMKENAEFDEMLKRIFNPSSVEVLFRVLR